MLKIYSLSRILKAAASAGYAVGAFSPRYTKMVRPVIQAAIEADSPAIIQVSEKELLRHKVAIEDFAAEFYRQADVLRPEVPLCLHLDHTKDTRLIERAVKNNFCSVMIDASEHDFYENIRITKEVTETAHKFGVSVEGELGKIGTTDFAETDSGTELYTDPEEARRFCEHTAVDALAVSVGTAHGAYTSKPPTIDFKRLKDIQKLTKVPLVLHGASGVPAEMLRKCVALETGGVSKVNIATDLEQAMLKSLGRDGFLIDEEFNSYPAAEVEKARQVVKDLVVHKMKNYLLSAGKA